MWAPRLHKEGGRSPERVLVRNNNRAPELRKLEKDKKEQQTRPLALGKAPLGETSTPCLIQPAAPFGIGTGSYINGIMAYLHKSVDRCWLSTRHHAGIDLSNRVAYLNSTAQPVARDRRCPTHTRLAARGKCEIKRLMGSGPFLISRTTVIGQLDFRGRSDPRMVY